MTGPGEMRIGYLEREAVVDDLRSAAEDGRITLEELDERLSVALVARTLAELDPLVADLPVDPPSRRFNPARPSGGPAGVQLRPGVPPPPGMDPSDPLRLDGGMSSVKRTGEWLIPPYLRIDPGVGTVHLDCVDARAMALVINVLVLPGAGSVKIILPQGWAANTDRLSGAWGTAKNKVSGVPAEGCPLLVIDGGAGMGSVVVRYPNRWEQRRRERHGLPGGEPQRQLPR